MPRAAHDFIAIGLGPFNLGLACLTDPIDDLDGLFIEKNDYFNWHPGMLLEGATLQTPFMGDLVTLADPTLAEISRILFTVDDAQKLNCLFTDVFDCFFRYLAAILDEHGMLPEARFWRLVADCILRYQDAHPERAEKYAHYDLFAPQFTRNCLNRLQLANNQQMLNLLDPKKSLQFVGSLDNPIAGLDQARRGVELSRSSAA